MELPVFFSLFLILDMTVICDLSNEIFLEVFDYLDVWDLFRAFGNLNRRFYRLIDDRRISFQSNLLSMNFKDFFTYENVILPRMGSFIRYLTISDQWNYLQKILRCISLDYLISVKLYQVKLNELMVLLETCKFKSMLIDTKEIRNEKHLNEIFRMLFCQQLDLRFLQMNFHTNLFFHDQRCKLSQLRQIIIESPCFSSEIIVLISQLPKLRFLNARINDTDRESMDKDIDHYTGHQSLRSVILQIENVKYDRLFLLLTLMCNVQTLELNGKIDFDLNSLLEYGRNYRSFRCDLQHNLIY